MVAPTSEEPSVIARAFSLLRAFKATPVMGASDLERATGLPRGTVYRLAQQLVSVGALTRVGRKYRLGVTLLELGAEHYPSRLHELLHPLLVDLQRVTGADVATVEPSGGDVVVVDSVPARRSTATTVRIGARIPAHATAAGKVILAHRRTVHWTALELRPLTARTVVSVERLRKEVVDSRVAGVAYDFGETEDGRDAVAAPLFNRYGRILGALLAAGPAGDWDPHAAASAVAAIARTLTRVGQTANIGFYTQDG